mmetsp:Transcript_64571/g.134653  ORF Transcript_64571/g.134653 Transcript_64571/m.134653 type:complete len:233 (+) Transcript_64571:2970-3668(+)
MGLQGTSQTRLLLRSLRFDLGVKRAGCDTHRLGSQPLIDSMLVCKILGAIGPIRLHFPLVYRLCPECRLLGLEVPDLIVISVLLDFASLDLLLNLFPLVLSTPNFFSHLFAENQEIIHAFLIVLRNSLLGRRLLVLEQTQLGIKAAAFPFVGSELAQGILTLGNFLILTQQKLFQLLDLRLDHTALLFRPTLALPHVMRLLLESRLSLLFFDQNLHVLPLFSLQLLDRVQRL